VVVRGGLVSGAGLGLVGVLAVPVEEVETVADSPGRVGVPVADLVGADAAGAVQGDDADDELRLPVVHGDPGRATPPQCTAEVADVQDAGDGRVRSCHIERGAQRLGRELVEQGVGGVLTSSVALLGFPDIPQVPAPLRGRYAASFSGVSKTSWPP
jgi:hypothetical protein